MDFLLDTNILIPAEPTSTADVEPTTLVITDLLRLIQETGGRAVIHPDAFLEIAKDRDSARRRLRRSLIGKYLRLDAPPELSDELAEAIGRPQPGTHDALDAHLLEAVCSGSAGVLLVTDDAGLHRWAALAGLGDRVLTSSDALDMVRRLYEPPPVAPPAARSLSSAALNATDLIFDDLRQDYEGFDVWLSAAALQRRQAWVVENEDGSYAAVTIVKEETPGEHGLQGKLLKLCTFKVSGSHQGNRYGELLLKPVFDFASAHGYDSVFVEAKPDKRLLFAFLEQFGFRFTGVLKDGTDPVHAKTLRPGGDAAGLGALEFHVAFGPPAVRWRDVRAFIVPIQPLYHARLFPEAESQLSLSPGAEAHGNGIRKAYLCRASTRLVASGDLLYFYRSGAMELTVVGVAEDVHVLSEASAIVQAAGKRTLYTYADIEGMVAEGGDVLVIGFRQARVLSEPVPYADLKSNGVLKGAPQTVTSIGEEAAIWLALKIEL
jgi:ribosomal protein S18 acetylase RimI-like enzyme/predicted RNA-binding protein with PUA-like domain